VETEVHRLRLTFLSTPLLLQKCVRRLSHGRTAGSPGRHGAGCASDTGVPPCFPNGTGALWPAWPEALRPAARRGAMLLK